LAFSQQIFTVAKRGLSKVFGMSRQFGKRGAVAPAKARMAVATAVAAPALAPVLAPAGTRSLVHDYPSIVPTRAFSAKPISTFLILALLIVVFVAELNIEPPGHAFTPSLHAQMAIGALNPNAVFYGGQFWRVFTGPLMHGSLMHITGNAVIFVIIGFLLEPLIGSAWFAAIFFVGALGGALASLFFNSPHVVATGASGAIMALVVATFVCSFHDSASDRCVRMQMTSARVALPALLPAYNVASHHIDYQAHAGGALFGCLMGLLLLWLWPYSSARPAYRPVALIIIVLGLLGAAIGFHEASASPPPDEIASTGDGFIPDSLLPGTTPEGIAQSSDLVTRFPRDPRGHFFRGLHLLRVNDYAGARFQLQTALDLEPAAHDVVDPRFNSAVRLMLAVTLAAEGNIQEAKEVAGPACSESGKLEGVTEIMAFLQKSGVCAE
jgi:rhomboid protease GluP